MTQKNTLICTLGTSLLRPNLMTLPTADGYAAWLNKQPPNDQPHFSAELISALADAHAAKNTAQVAQLLAHLPGATRLCGAEINSITDLIAHGYCQSHSTICCCHSDTDDGRYVADILRHYYTALEYPITLYCIPDLQDHDPKRFRTKGLRNLAKIVCRIIRERGASFCAINATGGYKAQIAIGVLMGQALEVPVYYKHELFSEIIAFPPMPIALDQQVWMRHSGLFLALDRCDVLAQNDVEITDWDERLETLVERVDIDGVMHVELSASGQIFHDTFNGRFASERDRYLPPPVSSDRKAKPIFNDHNWGHARTPILNFMQRLIDTCPYVQGCRTNYWNPSLGQTSHFRLTGGAIEGVYSNGSWTVKITIETSATTIGQREACIADLNSRLNSGVLS